MSLNGWVEGALFEGQQVGVLVVGAGAFGEDEDGLVGGVHVGGGGAEGGEGGGAVGAVNEDGVGERHYTIRLVVEPKGGWVYVLNCPRKAVYLSDFLPRYAHVFGKHGTQHCDIEFPTTN